MTYPARLVSALPLVFSVGAVQDSVTLSVVGGVAAPEELEPPVAPLDELPEPEVEATGLLPEEVELFAAPLDELPELEAEANGVLPDELELRVAPLDEPPELDAEAKGLLEEVELLVPPLDELPEVEVAATGVGAIGVLATLVAAPLPALTGGVTATLLLASLTEPALSVEPPHPARAIEMADAPRNRANSARRFRLIFMPASLIGKTLKRSGECVSIGEQRTDGDGAK